jgi:ribosomal protein L40E
VTTEDERRRDRQIIDRRRDQQMIEDLVDQQMCDECDEALPWHATTCSRFASVPRDSRLPPVYPFTGREDEPRTHREHAKRMYIEAMYHLEMHKWHTARGEEKAAADFMEMFKGATEICQMYEKRDRNEPVKMKWVAQPCLTEGCSGIFWTTNTEKYSAAKNARPQPSGKCNACRTKDLQS